MGLTAMPRWIRWEYRESNGKRTKIPFMVGGKPASTTDPSTWTTFDNVAKFDKIGFVFCKEDGFLGIDLDHVIRAGQILPWGADLVRGCNSYTEISPSGEGLHSIGFGSKPAWLTKSRIDLLDDSALEIYDSGRYFTMTGQVFENYRELGHIDVEKVFSFLKQLEPTKETTISRHSSTDRFNVSVHSIIAGFKEGERTSHPFHDSLSGSNFMVEKGGVLWRCWRHSFSHNALHLLGQKEGIVQCGEKPSREEWKLILKAAENEGLIPKTWQSRAERVRDYFQAKTSNDNE